MKQRHPWTPRQIARLRQIYLTASAEDLQRELAPHSIGSIRGTAIRLGLRRRGRCHDWKAICAAHKAVLDFGRHSFK